jgi:hypothetical protein
LTFLVPAPDRAKRYGVHEGRGNPGQSPSYVTRRLHRFSALSPPKARTASRALLFGVQQDFLQIGIGYGRPVLLVLQDDWQLDEIVIPCARVDLLAFIVDCRRDDKLRGSQRE